RLNQRKRLTAESAQAQPLWPNRQAMKHSHAAVERLRVRLLDVLLSDHPDETEVSWRMEIIIRWWLDQMNIATHGNTDIMMQVLTQALKIGRASCRERVWREEE